MPTLIQIADAALADSYARAGDWMACHPGCHQCCIGVFAISPADADRLRAGLAAAEPALSDRIHLRAAAARLRLTPGYPGDAASGELFTEPHHEAAFDDFANDEPCPVLNPLTHTCDLYAARPLPCRTFGPPMPTDEGGFGVCELCFVEAPPSEVERCAVDAHFLHLAAETDAADPRGPTLIAFALTEP